MPFEPPQDADQVRARRIAGRCHLAFHIEMSPVPHANIGWLTEHNGLELDTREATDPELDMWRTMEALSGDLNRATLRELQDTLRYHEGICYLNALDLATLLQDPEFTPKNRRAELLDGYVGDYGKLQVYVSREVPPGWAYLPQERDEQLHWRPRPQRQVRPSLDDSGFWMFGKPLLAQ